MAAKKQSPKPASKDRKIAMDAFWGEIKWPLLCLFLLSSFIMLAVMIFLCKQLFVDKSKPHIEEPLKHLGKRLQKVLKDPQLKLEKPQKIAEEAIKLPAYIKHAHKKLQDYKKSYCEYRDLEASGLARRVNVMISSKNWDVCKGLESFWDESILHFKRKKYLNYLTTQLTEPSWIGLSAANKGDNWEWSDGSKLITECVCKAEVQR